MDLVWDVHYTFYQRYNAYFKIMHAYVVVTFVHATLVQYQFQVNFNKRDHFT